MLSPVHSNHVCGASALESAGAGEHASVTTALGDGSRFTFTRLADLHTLADA